MSTTWGAEGDPIIDADYVTPTLHEFAVSWYDQGLRHGRTLVIWERYGVYHCDNDGLSKPEVGELLGTALAKLHGDAWPPLLLVSFGGSIDRLLGSCVPHDAAEGWDHGASWKG